MSERTTREYADELGLSELHVDANAKHVIIGEITDIQPSDPSLPTDHEDYDLVYTINTEEGIKYEVLISPIPSRGDLRKYILPQRGQQCVAVVDVNGMDKKAQDHYGAFANLCYEVATTS